MTVVNVSSTSGNTALPNVAVVNCSHGCAGPCHQRINNLVVYDDQSTIKGLLWGVGAFKVGTATLGLAGTTLMYSPFILLPPLAIVPVGLGLTTLVLGSITGSCFNNACYHLGSRQVKVVHTY